ncbi:single-stranded DNA-binding protein [Nocardioides marmoribigeumensis]|jgi:single-strand DNA-binding protein|uniref:Single-stranded DNA-binding protein n=1 Tax=Nocardioides marmoribigeumensis TaxID=433649 RepID=A0ABU2BUI6_9ACTN|nr:single-stranded DNA-binding protein [Nocardioides marmoribigeumensis]MDR7362296.1 single-strand DNA-binding protein [Nocardioides marmoribigeumensis]
MAGETPITVIGNLTADPELRFTPSGAAVANFTVASTPRTFDKNTNEWKDGEALFLNCSVWRQAAENVAESLVRGSRVIVSGRLKARSYETREGEKRTVFEIDVDEIGPSLKYATAKVAKTQRSGGQGGGFGGGQGGGGYQGGQGGGTPGGQGGGGFSDDPWATPGVSGGQPQGGGSGGQPQGGGSWGGQGGGQPAQDPWGSQGGSSDEPPF